MPTKTSVLKIDVQLCAALYIRVSTDAQFEEGYSVDAQKEMLVAYCKSKSIPNYKFYIDGGFTGSNIERPEMIRLIDDSKNGKINYVIVYKLDRLSRSQKDTLYLIEDVFLPHNVDFISINESFDTSTAFGRAMIGILSVFAQLERENIRMRTRMGMQKRVESGLWMGGGRIPYGYDYDKNQGILTPSKDADNVRKIYDLYLHGYSPDKIAKIIGLKYDRLVVQILTRKTNAGYICYNNEEYMGQHEAIISLETYQKTMDMMQERSVQRIATSNYLLTGIIYCGKCGAKMRYQKWGKYGVKLICYSQQSSKAYLIKDPNCDNEKVWADVVEDAVIKDIFKMSIEKSQKEQSAIILTPIDMLNQQYDILANKIKRLYNLYANDSNDLLLSTIEENKNSLNAIQKQIESERSRNVLLNKMKEVRYKIDTISESWDYMTTQEKQNILRSCIEKIIVTDNNIDIHYKFLG